MNLRSKLIRNNIKDTFKNRRKHRRKNKDINIKQKLESQNNNPNVRTKKLNQDSRK